jgi:hypothetical protein
MADETPRLLSRTRVTVDRSADDIDMSQDFSDVRFAARS